MTFIGFSSIRVVAPPISIHSCQDICMSASGRPRDPDLDERILDAARRLLAERGYQGLSIDAVARAAGTTRPTVSLRFAGKEERATSAVAGMAVEEPLPQTDDIHADLVAELRHFR